MLSKDFQSLLDQFKAKSRHLFHRPTSERASVRFEMRPVQPGSPVPYKASSQSPDLNGCLSCVVLRSMDLTNILAAFKKKEYLSTKEDGMGTVSSV